MPRCLKVIFVCVLFTPLFLKAQNQNFDMVDSLVKAGQVNKAIALLNTTAQKQKSYSDWKNYFDTRRKQSRVLGKENRFDEVLAMLKVEIPICKLKLGNASAELSKLLRERATAFEKSGEFETSLEVLREAEQIARKSKDNEELLSVLQQAGGMYYQAGDYHAALPYMRESVPVGYEAMKNDSMKMGRLNYLLGSAYWGTEKPDSCKLYYQRALDFWLPSQGPEFRYVGEVYNVLGEFAWKEGNEKLALDYFNKYAAIQLKNNPNTIDYADNLIEKAQNLSGNENLDEMLAHYKEALEFRTQALGANNPAAAGCYNYIARVLSEMQNPELALKTCQQAIELYCPGFLSKSEFENPKSLEKATSYQLLLDVLMLKYNLLNSEFYKKSQPALQSAEGVVRLCIQLFDELRTGRRTEDAKIFWSEKLYPFFENALFFYDENFNHQLSTTQQNRVLELMEKSKAFILNEALKNAEALEVSGVPIELQQREKELLQKLNDALRFLSLEEKRCEAADTAKLVAWRNELQSLRLEHELLIDKFEKDYPQYFALKYDRSTSTVEEIQQRLTVGQVFIEYFFGSSNVYFVRISNTEFEFGKLCASDELQFAITQFRNYLTNISYVLQHPDSAFLKFTNWSHQLFRMLIPMEKTPGQLLIVTDGPIALVSFDVLLQTLPSGQTKPYSSLDYLLKYSSISYTPNATTWISSLSKKKNSERKYFGFAPGYSSSTPQPQFVSRAGIVPLKYNDDEVLAAEKLLGGKTFLNAFALESTMRNESSEAGILHLAMHTILNDSLPLLSGFLFEQEEDSVYDGVLSAQEIYSLNLYAQLALLSACNTGTGTFQRGEGMMSLARAFNYAGCPSLVYTLWECDDENTQKIVVAFLENLKSGMSKDEALRQAKLAYLKNSDAHFSHPYYWASMVSQGNQEPVDFSNNKPWIFGGAAVLLGALAGKMLRRRRKFQGQT